MKILLALVSLSLLLQGGGPPQAVVIPIENPTFVPMDALMPGQCGLYANVAPGWQFGPGSRLYEPSTSSSCLSSSPPVGKTVGVAGYGSTFLQVLNTTPQEVQRLPNGDYTEGFYTLKFSEAGYFEAYPGQYEVEIDFGTQQLCEAYGWSTRPWAEVMLTCPATEYIVAQRELPGGGLVQGTLPFVIHFTVNDGSANGGWPVMFTNVSLTFTPEAP